MQTSTAISIIIPIGPSEDRVVLLLADLAALTGDFEVLIIPFCPEQRLRTTLKIPEGLSPRVRWVEAQKGRARQMNAGAEAAANPYLLFLHADSRITPSAFRALQTAITKAPFSLHYFRLKFEGPGSRFAILNQWGANIRCALFGLPFGDQGLSLRADVFEALGGYSTEAAYGEDHLLVWAAKSAKITVRSTKAALATSARKYQTQGWIKTTLKHQRIWLTQAFSQAFRLLHNRLRGRQTALPVLVAKDPEGTK